LMPLSSAEPTQYKRLVRQRYWETETAGRSGPQSKWRGRTRRRTHGHGSQQDQNSPGSSAGLVGAEFSLLFLFFLLRNSARSQFFPPVPPGGKSRLASPKRSETGQFVGDFSLPSAEFHRIRPRRCYSCEIARPDSRRRPSNKTAGRH
jgi:hypothetical protein